MSHKKPDRFVPRTLLRERVKRFAGCAGIALLVGIGLSCEGDEGNGEAEMSRAALCERARDRAVELQVDPNTPDRAVHIAAMREAVGARMLADCQRTDSPHSDDAIRCMRRADTSDALAACTAATDGS